jgi:hypothetical protein
MGAYENPPMISFQTTGAGNAWANAAASFGKNIGAAIVARAKKDEEELEKENKERKEILESQKAWAFKGAQEEQRLRESQEFKSLTEKVQQATIKNFRSRWGAIEKQQFAKTPEEVQATGREVNKWNNYAAKASDQLNGINDFVIEATGSVADFADKTTLRAQGTLDNASPLNTKLVIAGQIMNGMNGYKGDYELGTDADGNQVMDFTYTLNGEQKSFQVNADELEAWKSERIPEMDKLLNGALVQSGFLVGEGKEQRLADKYFIKGTNNEREFETVTTIQKDLKTGKYFQRTITRPKLNKELMEADWVLATNNIDLNDNQKVSAFQQIFRPLDQNKTLSADDAKYGDIGKAAEINQEKYAEGAGYYAGAQAEQAYNSAMASLTKEGKPQDIEDENKISILDKVNTAFDDGAPYMTPFGKAKLEVKSSIPPGDTTGWFKDAETKKYYRVLEKKVSNGQEQFLPNTYVTNRNEALQFFGANVLPVPEPLNPN